MSELLNSVTGGGSLPRLAEDLTFTSDLLAGEGYKQITGIDGTLGYTAALSLTGKFSISFLMLTGFTSGTLDIRLTIDGEVIWDSNYLSATDVYLLGSISSTSQVASDSPIKCNSSFLLEISTSVDSTIGLNYLARPLK